MHFLITGHTGFKGAWLSLLLRERGHQVSGVSLETDSGSLYHVAKIDKILEHDIRCDIRNLSSLERYFKLIKPDVVIHLAAQALVGESYKNPLDTFNINTIGTVNVLRASQSIGDLKAQLIITTDKVYKNVDKVSGYTESDSLGGQDPYSASKAMADIATQSWLSSFENAPTAIARAGNVIGGGDVGEKVARGQPGRDAARAQAAVTDRSPESAVGAVGIDDGAVDGPLRGLGHVGKIKGFEEFRGHDRVSDGRIFQRGGDAAAGQRARGDETHVFLRAHIERRQRDGFAAGLRLGRPRGLGSNHRGAQYGEGG